MRIRCIRAGGRITQPYGYDVNYPLNNGWHYGTDYVHADKRIVSPMDSKVTAIGYDKVNGNYLVLESGVHRDWFSHIENYLVKVNDTVRIGQELAIMGDTGYATGIHVHHSLRVRGVRANPEEHITGEDMAEIDVLRIVASEVEGFDMVNTHTGKHDKILTDAWGSKPIEDYIRHAWNIQKKHRGHLQNTIDAQAGQISLLTAQVADLKENSCTTQERQYLNLLKEVSK